MFPTEDATENSRRDFVVVVLTVLRKNSVTYFGRDSYPNSHSVLHLHERTFFFFNFSAIPSLIFFSEGHLMMRSVSRV
jgi:hypothetical protein